MSLPPALLSMLVFAIAVLYASAGFGGASGYLAVMSFFKIPIPMMASTALTLNIIVSTISATQYARAGHLRLRLLLPFLAASVPAAFLGGMLKISDQTYTTLLYLALTYLAMRMLFLPTPVELPDSTPRPAPIPAMLAGGAAIGLLSGMLGIGGGIFLSPLILFLRWGSVKQAAAVSGGFIAVNSVSGLLGRLSAGTFLLGEFSLWLLPAGVLGALIGSTLGARAFSSAHVRRVLACILLIAVGGYWFGVI
jgi:hypothetical protein